MYYERAYIYNNSYKAFEDKPIKLSELVNYDKNHDGRLSLIRHELYSHNIYDKNYKLAFVNPADRKPYLRSVNATEFKKKGFASVCESPLHFACKNGIAAAEQLRIRINSKDYIVHKSNSICEERCCLMERDYETDCKYVISEIGQEINTILSGNVISFEVHHTSPVKEDKGLTYMLSGRPIIEFDILLDFIPDYIKRNTCSLEDRVAYFKSFYEDTDKHYISGAFFKPFVYPYSWEECKSTINHNGENLSALIFKKNGSFRIIYKKGDKKSYDNDYFNNEMMEYDTAKKFAEYRIMEHIEGRKKLFN